MPQDGSALTHQTHVLLLGTDSAPTAARRGLRHTDSIMLVRSDPDHNRVAYLSIPQGVGSPFTDEGPAAEGDYVLAVATLEPRKNVPQLLEGFRRARLDGCELRVVGAAGWGDVEVGGDRVRRLGWVPDEELAALYRGARCLVYPSLYEGFGLPVLEAMAAGTSVVCPAGPPYDEIAGGIAVTCDPLDPDSIAAALEEASARRAELRVLGRERAAAFTWERTARATLDVYREVAS
jgi:alpha-1,3-rhamnosyl/mannosyltransferase